MHNISHQRGHVKSGERLARDEHLESSEQHVSKELFKCSNSTYRNLDPGTVVDPSSKAPEAE